MRSTNRSRLAATLLMAACLTSANPALAQDLASPMIPPKPGVSSMPPEVRGAWGCVIAGTAGTAVALSADSINLLNVVAGGIVLPNNPTVLYLGLAGVVFTTFCTLGQQLAPLYTYYFVDQPQHVTDDSIDTTKAIRSYEGAKISAVD